MSRVYIVQFRDGTSLQTKPVEYSIMEAMCAACRAKAQTIRDVILVKETKG